MADGEIISPQYDLTGPTTKGIRGGLAVGCVSIRTLHLYQHGLTENKTNVIAIETVVIATDCYDASGSIIFLVSPDVGNGQCMACAVDCFDAIAGVVIERSTRHRNERICPVDVHAGTNRVVSVHVAIITGIYIIQGNRTGLIGRDRNSIALVVGCSYIGEGNI